MGSGRSDCDVGRLVVLDAAWIRKFFFGLNTCGGKGLRQVRENSAEFRQ